MTHLGPSGLVGDSTRVAVCQADRMGISARNFDSAAQLYDEIRPTYPNALLDALFVELPARPRIVEVGPGTGQATLAILERDAIVTAVEFGPTLAAVLKARAECIAAGELSVVVGDFETVDLPDRDFDAVVAATSYHWISAEAQISRPAQLLKPGGMLAVIDTNQVDDPADRGYFDAVDAVFGRYGQTRSAPPPTEEELVPAIVATMEADPRCTDITVTSKRRDLTYTCDEYDRLLRTFSGPQSLPEPGRTALIDALCDVARTDFGGTVTRPLVFTLTTARVHP